MPHVDGSAPGHPGSLALAYDIRTETVPTVEEFLERAISWFPPYGHAARQGSLHATEATVGIEPILALRNKLMKGPPRRTITKITVDGAFFPALLLCSGWWERKGGRKLAEATRWRDEGLQHWLFSGFELWGPSCSVNRSDDAGEPLVGQIGFRDEAESLPLVVAGEKAAALRERLCRSAQAFNVRATGSLCHRSLIPGAEMRRQVSNWGKSFDYCLLVSADEPDHGIAPAPSKAEMYSGYLWQCWLPESWAPPAGISSDELRRSPPSLDSVYFVWEHTNFANSDAIKYNLESLQRKVEFLGRRHGRLILLHNSSELIEGSPALPSHEFYEMLVNRTNPAA